MTIETKARRATARARNKRTELRVTEKEY